ncbi:MAG: GGDEF domain-containing protein [Desulfotomaculales bacterium]
MFEFLWRGKLKNTLLLLFVALAGVPFAACLIFHVKNAVWFLLAGIFLVAVLWIYSFFVIRQILNFIDIFQQAINEIMSGHPGASFTPRYFAEFDQVVESFDSMSHQLAFTFQRLQERIALLEEQSAQAQTAQEAAERNNLRLKELIIKDPLTGVYNRRYLMEQLNRQVKLSMRHRQPMAVLFIDIDYFKEINDTYGHQAGDEVLREFVRTLSLTVRSTDILTRYGGEEFIILAPQTDEKSAVRLAERIRRAVAASAFPTAKGTVHFTVSVGVSTFKGEEINEPESVVGKLLELADRRCYEAKVRGRNQVKIISLEENQEEKATF